MNNTQLHYDPAITQHLAFGFNRVNCRALQWLRIYIYRISQIDRMKLTAPAPLVNTDKPGRMDWWLISNNGCSFGCKQPDCTFPMEYFDQMKIVLSFFFCLCIMPGLRNVVVLLWLPCIKWWSIFAFISPEKVVG